jgi:hypothetical protein
MYRNEKIKKIADTYGWNKQCQMAIEEMSELTKAICKRQRKLGDCLFTESAEIDEQTAIVEEIADVKIMVAQLEYLLSAEGDVDEVIEQKLDRQLKRIENGG